MTENLPERDLPPALADLADQLAEIPCPDAESVAVRNHLAAVLMRLSEVASGDRGSACSYVALRGRLRALKRVLTGAGRDSTGRWTAAPPDLAPVLREGAAAVRAAVGEVPPHRLRPGSVEDLGGAIAQAIDGLADFTTDGPLARLAIGRLNNLSGRARLRCMAAAPVSWAALAADPVGEP